MQHRRSLIVLLVLCFAFTMEAVSQNEQPADSLELDDKYREDQFYFSATYNLIAKAPRGVSVNGVSGGLHFGFIRDMPVNKRRNVAIGVGAGLAFDRYGSNFFVGEAEDGSTIFRVLSDEDLNFESNRLTTSTIEAPFEIRWRSSTAATHSFWRVYAGLRVGYTYYYRTIFKQSGNTVNQTDIPEFERLRIGATLSFGYGTFNMHAYYGLNSFYENATTVDGQDIDLRTLKVGIIFYIL